MNGLGWTPSDGDTVHLNPRNRWEVPAGRYRLTKRLNGSWQLAGLTCDARLANIATAHLIAADVATTLTPIPGDELQREAERVRLRLHAPLRGNRYGDMLRQHDASDLALFRSANEPGLAL